MGPLADPRSSAAGTLPSEGKGQGFESLRARHVGFDMRWVRGPGQGLVISRHPACPRSPVGVVYSPIFTRQVSVPPQLGRVPTVLLNCSEVEPVAGGEPRCSSVEPSEVLGGFAATLALVDRCGASGGSPPTPGLPLRRSDLLDAEEDARVAFPRLDGADD